MEALIHYYLSFILFLINHISLSDSIKKNSEFQLQAAILPPLVFSYLLSLNNNISEKYEIRGDDTKDRERS